MAYETVEARVERVVNALMSIKPHYYVKGSNDIRVRCPYCGDSRKDATSAHMYIKLEPPFAFHCFRCETSGSLNSETIRDFKMRDNDVAIDVAYINKSSRGKVKQKGEQSRRSVNLSTTQSETVMTNLKYFNNRYNTHYTEKDVPELTEKYKIVFDPVQFFKNNKCDATVSGFDYSKAIGFVSSDGGYIVFRDSSGTQERRYNNFKLDKTQEYKKRYTVNTDVDIMSPKLNLVMAEGIFDIIGVKEYFYKDVTSKDYVFTAVCGKSYSEAIKHYIRLGFLDLNITIYSDKDVDIQFYKDLKSNSPLLKNTPITIYYNELEKDYGIPLERIKLRKAVI